jgi:hypothetical protein
MDDEDESLLDSIWDQIGSDGAELTETALDEARVRLAKRLLGEEYP